MEMPVVARWRAALAEFAPKFLRDNPILAPIAGNTAVVLYGSTCRGIDDALSDLDVWLIIPASDLEQLDAASPTRFFEFRLNDKPGHFTAVSAESRLEKMRGCDLTLIAELRNTCIIYDPRNIAGRLIADASRPMSDTVRRAFFQYHYVEFRGDDRAADHPLDRGDPFATISAQTAGLAHALQAAMVLHGEPYPYSKWLFQHATKTPTGRVIAPLVEQWIDLLGNNTLRDRTPSNTHALARKTKEIRLALIDAARTAGIDGPWLNEWWLHIDASRAGKLKVEWPCTC
jgi:hypothetical protein